MNPNQDNGSDEEMTLNTRKYKKKSQNTTQKYVTAPLGDTGNEEKSELSDLNFWLNDDVCEPVAPNLKKNPKETYDLKKGLKLSIAGDRSIINCSKTNSQKLTSVISLRTLELTSQEDQNLQELDPSENRLPVDLVAVIDCSGSMSGRKIKTVKESLDILLSFCSEKDRFAIVTFNDKGKKVMGLKRVNQANMDGIKKIIQSSLVASGSTSIPAGMEQAIRILKNRKQKNQIVSVFLLSDGNDNDNNADSVIRNMLQINVSDLEFTIHSFGFGDDHDSRLLSEISKMRNGNFYYIQELEQINECFVNAFGGLLSIVGREALLQVKLEKDGHKIKELSDLKWHKTYGDFWKLQPNTNIYEIYIQNLINGMKRDYVFDIQIPRITSNINDNQRDEILVTCTLTSKAISNDEVVTAKSTLHAKFYHEEEENKEANEELNEEVVINLFRVQVGEVIEKAVKLAESNQHADALKEIDTLINKILISKHSKNAQLKKFVEQLETSKENCKPEVFNDYGRHALINESEVTMKQTGLKHKKKKMDVSHDDDDEDNENTIQRTMKRKLKPQQKPQLGLSTVNEKSATEEFGKSSFNK